MDLENEKNNSEEYKQRYGKAVSSHNSQIHVIRELEQKNKDLAKVNFSERCLFFHSSYSLSLRSIKVYNSFSFLL